MLYVYNHYTEARAKAVRARDYIIENFSLGRVGSLLRERLENIYEDIVS
jgi:hypothetical protein